MKILKSQTFTLCLVLLSLLFSISLKAQSLHPNITLSYESLDDVVAYIESTYDATTMGISISELEFYLSTLLDAQEIDESISIPEPSVVNNDMLTFSWNPIPDATYAIDHMNLTTGATEHEEIDGTEINYFMPNDLHLFVFSARFGQVSSLYSIIIVDKDLMGPIPNPVSNCDCLNENSLGFLAPFNSPYNHVSSASRFFWSNGTCDQYDKYLIRINSSAYYAEIHLVRDHTTTIPRVVFIQEGCSLNCSRTHNPLYPGHPGKYFLNFIPTGVEVHFTDSVLAQQATVTSSICQCSEGNPNGSEEDRFPSNRQKQEDDDLVATSFFYQNPINEQMQLSLQLKKPSVVQVQFFDISGRQIKHWQSAQQSEGVQQFSINTSDLPSGLYTCTATVNDKQMHFKIVKAN